MTLTQNDPSPAHDFQVVIDVALKTHLICADDLVAGRISFIDLSRRNHDYAIIVKDGSSYFIKRPTNNKMAQSVRNEAAIYRIFSQLNPCEIGIAFAPRFYEFCEDVDLLVLEYVPGVIPLSADSHERQRSLKWIARALGKMIAQLHVATNQISANSSAFVENINLHEPPVFNLFTPSVTMYSNLSPANLHLIGELQQNYQVREQFEAARHSWNPSCLIHGDLKWDNILVYPTLEAIESRPLRIADWELAGFGDPAWDVASILAAYTSVWIQAEQLASKIGPRQHKSAPSLSALCRAFLDAYLNKGRLSSNEAVSILGRAIAYCGMKLVWIAIEAMQESRMLSATYLTHVQVGINILERPSEAMVHLFGLPCTAWPGAWLDASRLSQGRADQVHAAEATCVDETGRESWPDKASNCTKDL
jgi:aminoglycoside phosphotransferase (APT) family kinase protein